MTAVLSPRRNAVRYKKRPSYLSDYNVTVLCVEILVVNVNLNGGHVLVISGPTWNTETLVSASSSDKGGCGMSMIIRYIGETMRDATPQGEGERERERQENKRCVS